MRSLIALAAVAGLIFGSVDTVRADSTGVDGDSAQTSTQNISILGTCPASNLDTPGTLKIVYNSGGGGHWVAGTALSVVVTVIDSSSQVVSTITSGLDNGDPFVVPAIWDTNGQSAQRGISTVVQPATPSGTYTVDYSVSGNKVGGGILTKTASFLVTKSCTAPTDSTGPVITPTVVGTLGVGGWYTSDVTTSWSVSDPESTVTSTSGCVLTTINTDTAGTTLTCNATSAGGTSSQSVTIQRDATPPTAALVGGPADGGLYYDYEVPVAPTCDASDNLSGVASCTVDGYSDAVGTHTVTAMATDVAGNNNSASSTYAVLLSIPAHVDVTVTPPNGSNLWYTVGPVLIDWTVTGDPIPTISGCDDVTVTADQLKTPYTCTAANHGATASVTVTVGLDSTAPSVTVNLDRAASSTGWYNITTGAPEAKFTCSDATSGIAACPPDFAFSEGEDQSQIGTAYDKAGNSASDTVSNVDVDATAPTLTWNGGPAAGAAPYFGSVPAEPTCTAADDLSGPNGCIVSGYSATVGGHTMTATAHDIAGNETSEPRTYTVRAWTLTGFYQPVDMNGVYNVVKGGSTVPLKFEVFAGSTELTDLSVVKTFMQARIACDGTSPTDVIEVTTTGGTSLRYDTTGGQFIQNWKTPTGAGYCYKVTMTTQDGSSLIALFKLK